MNLLNRLKQKTPMTTKVFVAKILISFLFLLQKIVNNKSIDIYLIELLLHLHDLERVKVIISDHDDDVNYCRFEEHLKRFEALGSNANNVRLNFDINKYQNLLEVNEALIKKFPEEYLLHDRMARNYLAGGYQSKARKYFSLSLKLQRQQKSLEGKIGLIVFISMPRSGTGFVSKALLNGLGLKDLGSEIRFVDAWFPDYGIIEFPDYIADNKFNPMPDGIFSNHAGALDINLWSLSLITDKIIVNFRDPRQALISWVHYMDYLRSTGNVSGLVQYKIPESYFQFSFAKQIDWQIQNYFIKVNIEWIMGWLKANQDPDFPCKIHFSQHEVLAKNPKKYFQDVLSFYEIDENKFTFPKLPKFRENTHKRKGLTEEWRSVLSKEQIQQINKVIPEEWFKKFNWPIK